MTEMIEKCARAVMVEDGCGYTIDGARVLCDDKTALLGRLDPYGKPLLQERCDCRASAAAVIDALMEPSPEMLRAGIDNCATSIRQDRAGVRQMTTPFEDECADIFRAMLSKAKSE